MSYPDTLFLRAIGIILILNSHLDRFYPIPYLGTGGALGNSIFFFLSGFGVFLSQKKNSRAFLEWFAGRLKRIYPSLWIVLLLVKMPLMIIAGKLYASTIIDFIGYFFNPPYWFLMMLLVYYIFSFRLLTANYRKTLGVFVMLIPLYIGCYVTWVDLSRWSIEKSPFDLIHYLMIFIFGIFLANKSEKIVYSGSHNFIILLLFISVLYFHKYLMTKGLYFEYQIIQQLVMYPIVFYLLKISRSSLITSQIMQNNYISPIFKFLGNHTLEIYMVHETIIYPVLKLGKTFPENLTLFLVLTFGISYIVNKLAVSIRKNLK